MPKIEVITTGDKKINRMLKRLTSKEAKKILRKSMRHAMKPVQQEAKGNAKQFKESGVLQRSIKIRSLKRSRTGFGIRVSSSTKTGKFNGGFYGSFQEFGTKAIAKKQFMTRAANTKGKVAVRLYREKVKQDIRSLAR